MKVGRDRRIEEDKRKTNAPVAQLDRVADFESEGRGFESLRARHKEKLKLLNKELFLLATSVDLLNKQAFDKM